MNCPKCGADSRVIETRSVSPNMLRRRRACSILACNYKFTTLEVISFAKAKHTDLVVLVIPRSIAESGRGLLDLISRGLAGQPPQDAEVTEPAVVDEPSER